MKVNQSALISAIITIVVIVIVELVEDITLTEDCLLYLAVFLTLVKVLLYQKR